MCVPDGHIQLTYRTDTTLYAHRIRAPPLTSLCSSVFDPQERINLLMYAQPLLQ